MAIVGESEMNPNEYIALALDSALRAKADGHDGIAKAFESMALAAAATPSFLEYIAASEEMMGARRLSTAN
jgi:hypothetical protein